MNTQTLLMLCSLASIPTLPACSETADPIGLEASDEGSSGEVPADDSSSGVVPDDAEDTDADGGDSTSAGGDGDPFAGCERDLLEDDLAVIDPMGMPGPARWYGPGADPETGELIDDGATTYHVSATYLALQVTPEAQEAFVSVLPAINEALFTNPGLVAVQLADSRACATARTFTVWSDEAAMMEFVTSDAHMDAARQIGLISRGGSVAIVWPDALASEIDWARALERLSDAESIY